MSASSREQQQAADLSPDVKKQLGRSRVGVLVVATAFGVISLLSLVGFVVNLTLNYPGTEMPVITVDRLWMVGHLVRGLALGWLTVCLWRYQAAAKRWSQDAGAEQFIRAQTAAWLSGAVVLVVLIAYATIYVGMTMAW